jgi:predicted HicB family RNase H-like nuclease
MKASERKAKAGRYLKIVEWSDEDKCFVGRCPGLFSGGCHGDDEAGVYRELCEIAEEWIEILEEDGRPLPAPNAGKKYSGKFVVRISPELHQRAALQAMARGESLNQFVSERLAGVA